MKSLIEKEVLFVETNYPIDKVIRLMSNSSRKVKFPGIAIVIDKNISMKGLVQMVTFEEHIQMMWILILQLKKL